MGGSGFAFSAIESLKNNKRTKKRNLDSLKPVTESEFTDHKKSSPKLLRKIRSKIQNEEKETRKKMIVKTAIVLFFVLIGFWILDNYWKEILGFISMQ
jgi:hypothetical protein